MTIHDEIKRHMALAFFACAYADQADECDQPMRGEIMEQLPADIDPAALHAADTLAIGLCLKNGIETIDRVYLCAQLAAEDSDDKGDRELTPELFGHYLAMQAMGTGVGLESFGYAVRDVIDVPSCEFGSYSLEKDYFTPAEQTED